MRIKFLTGFIFFVSYSFAQNTDSLLQVQYESALKKLTAGESVSYNRKAIMKKDSIIATVRIGYADGYPRRLGNSIGKMLVNGEPAPVTGTVCMDMVMLDITELKNVKEGDEVIVFGKDLSILELAQSIGTIPYEILTNVGERVKRVFFTE